MKLDKEIRIKRDEKKRKRIRSIQKMRGTLKKQLSESTWNKVSSALEESI